METDMQIREKIGSKRKIQQVYDIGYFEIKRNLKKTLILMAIAAVIFILFMIIEEIQLGKGIELPEDPANFAIRFLMMINSLVLISATSYGGSIIVIDFEKLTGNILFPKISRERLFVGRFLANYLMNAFVILFYYILVAINVFIKYTGIPKILWISLGWALLYVLLILSFTIFFSSFMRSTAGAVVISLIINMIVFSIIQSVISFVSTVEPLFILPYYATIITGCFNMPEGDRFQTIVLEGVEGLNLTMTLWTTPSPQGALIGTAIFSFVFLFSAFLIFRNRQNK